MTEDQARALLRDCDGLGGLERWMAAHPWHVTPKGWVVLGDLQGWFFEVAPEPGGLRITASDRSGARPAVWMVPAP